jgi:hypothetical protein
MVSSAFDDISRDGRIGSSTIELLYATVRTVVRVRRLPAPPEFGHWTDDAFLEVAHDFIVERNGLGRLGQLYALASDQESFERVLHEAVYNHLSSQARRTERTALRRRLRDVLENDGRFVEVAGVGSRRLWTLAATNIREQYTGQVGRLVEAAWAVQDIKTIRWRSANRHGPVAERESLARLCEHILREAGTSMRLDTLVQVVARRFNLGEPPATVLLDDVEVSGGRGDLQDTGVAVDETAEALWEQLTDREKRTLPYLAESVRDAAEHLGAGKSQVALTQKRLREILKAALADDPDGEAVLNRLYLLADELADRTAG